MKSILINCAKKCESVTPATNFVMIILETNQVYAMASEITGSEKTAEDNLPPSSNIASGSSSQTSNLESKKG